VIRPRVVPTGEVSSPAGEHDHDRLIAWFEGNSVGGERRDHRRRRTGMAGVQRLDFDSPDESRTPEKTRVDLVRVGNTTIGRFAFQPGWRWSDCIKPVVGTDSCQARHVGIVQSGSMHVVHDDGTEVDLAAGDAYVIEPGHDAWITGSDPFVGFEFESRSAEEYARE
jgi:hypothetical protein